ncbi:DUF373 family protein [Methanimicrococcus blatticola]|uniref:Putative membrane protein n=1 Tax=Methanimicrococcus blatticola TaxID=91560 RepID=A0A484F8G0_9EURY|nr:DUF373 family protein [Methanimicrococcus blatticola]MBZ3934854.1 DUF373 family protein [Methanimicrococcus blatticola]MCC2509048.1 DUF373 family protein [Methanimicrococcus blatticola]TDQ70927.1 putative membrane protein [Methanimicrococcus blatticola]
MDTLVICIDRDNDLGEKAKVITPVIGRGANIAAAVSLATVDPEDSDTNTIFGGIRILDELRSLGVDAEIVSFAGDKNVGTISDKKIAEQLDEFLANQDAKSAVFVSDGAEDESLVPLVQSRIKVDSVQRIVVMQSENLESTYYMIKNFLKDPKLLQTFFVPIGLALIIYALAMATSNPQWAIIGTFFVVGIYMIIRAYSLNDKLILSWSELKKSFNSHQLSFVTTLAAIFLFIVGTISGSISVWNLTGGEISYYGFLLIVSLYIKKAILWYAGSAFVYLLGKIVDCIYAKQEYQSLVVEMLFVLAGTLLFWSAGSYALSTIMPELGYVFSVAYFIYSIVLAVIIGLVGIYFSAQKTEEPEEEKIQEPPKESKPKKPETTIIVKDGTEQDDDDEETIPKPVKIKIGIRSSKE